MSAAIVVLGHTINVESTFKMDGIGMSSLSDCYIGLKDSAAFDTKRSTFMHELVHIIANIQDIELSEQDVSGLALGFMSFLDQNFGFEFLDLLINAVDGTIMEEDEIVLLIFDKLTEEEPCEEVSRRKI